MAELRRKYDRAFKYEAVKLVVEGVAQKCRRSDPKSGTLKLYGTAVQSTVGIGHNLYLDVGRIGFC